VQTRPAELRLRLHGAFRAFLERRRAWLAIVLVALALVSPSLAGGLVADDYVLALLARVREPIAGFRGAPLDLFVFLTGDPRTTHAMIDAGAIPWTTGAETKIHFFRPLASLTHWLDFRVWQVPPWAMHLHSLAWFALALAAVRATYARLLTPAWIATLAFLIYAIDDAHAGTVEWISNRNAWMALAFGLPSLVFHHRARTDPSRRARAAFAVLAALSLSLGLACAESGIGACAYLLAYAIHRDDAPWQRRAASLVPYGAVLVAWRVTSTALGFGTYGAALYLDPAARPLAFLRHLPERTLSLLAGQLAFPFAELYGFADFRGASWVLGTRLLALALVAVVVLAALPRLRRDPTLRMFASGGLLATVPVAATFPADRLLVWVSVGAAPLVAALVARVGEASPSRFARTVRGAVVVVHLVLAPLLTPFRARSWAPIAAALDRAEASIPKDDEGGGRDVVLLNPAGDFLVGYARVMRTVRGTPMPSRLRWLATTTDPLRVTRVDDNTLRLEPERGFLANVTDRMLRDPAQIPFRAGDSVALAGMQLEVVRVLDDGRPAIVLARFDASLDDPRFRFMRFERGAFVPVVLPAVGEAMTVPGTSLFDTIYGSFGGNAESDGSGRGASRARVGAPREG
jgi:hypothetical protein